MQAKFRRTYSFRALGTGRAWAGLSQEAQTSAALLGAVLGHLPPPDPALAYAGGGGGSSMGRSALSALKGACTEEEVCVCD